MAASVKAASKLALVTGAGSGYPGKATALALLGAGYRVACGYNANREGAEAIQKSHASAFAVKIDIASRALGEARRCRGQRSKHFKAADFDIVVNNAAALVQGEMPFETITDADWDRMLAVNLRGAFIVAQETLPGMLARKSGAASSTSPPLAGNGGGMRQVHSAHAAKAGLINLKPIR